MLLTFPVGSLFAHARWFVFLLSLSLFFIAVPIWFSTVPTWDLIFFVSFVVRTFDEVTGFTPPVAFVEVLPTRVCDADDPPLFA